MKQKIFALMLFLAISSIIQALDIPLSSAPHTTGKPLMQNLAERKSARDFSTRALPTEVLSDLLWAANGINRADGHRTAPTGLNVQDIDIYVILQTGIYRYNAIPGRAFLQELRTGDFRHAAGKQLFAQQAPVCLVYVQNLDKAMKGDDTTRARHAGIHTGAIMQNVYLFCASANLISVARDYIDRNELTPLLGLADNQRIILAQSVGYSASVAAIPVPTAATTQSHAVAQSGSMTITEKQAIQIALKHAGILSRDASRIHIKCEHENKRSRAPYYEIEFKYNGFEYDYDVDATTGVILKNKRERD